ncbi:MAG: acyl-CoA dehydrogenase family protein [Burkholderiales bacterium]
MRFAFSEEQAMLRDMLRGALQREAGLDKVRRWAESADLRAFAEIASRNAWIGIGVDEEIGGQGGSLIEQAILFEELGRSGAPSGALLGGAGALLSFGTGAAAHVDPAVARSALERSCALCVSAGRAADTLTTDVCEVRGRLSGTVPLVLNATAASDLLVPIPGAHGIDLWFLPTATSGVMVKPRHLIDMTREFGDVVLSDAQASHVGRVDHSAAVRANAALALLVAAESLGLARRMLEMTVDYVSQRVQFGVPVGSFQAVKHAAAEAFVDIEAVHSGVYYTAWALANGEPDALLHAWIAKSFAGEAAVRTADCALRLHGAIGYTWEYDLQLLYKRAKINLELFGSPRGYRERIASAVLAPPS